MIRISQKSEHAVRAVLDLALFAPPQGGVRASEIAQRTLVPGKFLDAILRDLRKAGFVVSKRGPDGGHWLARDPSRITVAAIMEAIDGPRPRPTKPGQRGRTPADVSLQTLWEKVSAALFVVVDGVTIEDLRRQATPDGGADYVI